MPYQKLNITADHNSDQDAITYTKSLHRNALNKVESDILKALEQIENQRIDLTTHYENWVKLGFAFASLGEAGRDYFHRLSSRYANYSYQECNKQFDHCLRAYDGSTNIATFFQYCKDAGITVSSPVINRDEANVSKAFSDAVSQLKAVSGTPPKEYWKDKAPLSLESALKPVLPLTNDMLPEPFLNWIADIADRMQCPIDFPAVASIVAVGSVIGTRCTIIPKRLDSSWMVVPNLYGGIVGDPSMMKTPSMAEAMKPLDRLEAEARQGNQQAVKEYEANKAEYEAIKANLKKQMHKPGNGAKEQFATLDPPEPPTEIRYKTNDATIEKLAELLQQNPRGMLIFRDELVGLFRSWEKQGHESDRAFYLEAWNGNGSHTSDRIGRGTIHTDICCISLMGGIQPEKLRSYLYDAMKGAGGNDGMVQRLQMVVYPDPPASWKYVDRPPESQGRDRAYCIFQRLASMNFSEFGAMENESRKFKYLKFDNQAQAHFEQWFTELHTVKLKNPDLDTVMEEHLSKYKSLFPSLALIFHLIAVADGIATGPVSLQAAEQAGKWCEYLESHARRLYGMVTNYTEKAADILSKHIKEGVFKEGSFTIRDVQRKGWSMLKERDDIQSALDYLIEKNWIREIQQTENSIGRPSATVYQINPSLRK
jgi:hypothetical protein